MLFLLKSVHIEARFKSPNRSGDCANELHYRKADNFWPSTINDDLCKVKQIDRYQFDGISSDNV